VIKGEDKRTHRIGSSVGGGPGSCDSPKNAHLARGGVGALEYMGEKKRQKGFHYKSQRQAEKKVNAAKNSD